MNRLKVLISAHELSPDQGSECAVGWNLVTRIARYHDVTVLYAAGSQFSPNAYESAVNKYYTENHNEFDIKFIAVPQPKTTLFMAAVNKRISRNGSSIGISFLYFWGYHFWQKSAYKVAKRLVSTDNYLSLRKPFDLIHHLTSVTFREPGYLWKLPIPFIWGPTGGTTTIPVRFYTHIGIRAAIHEAFRAITNKLTFRLSPVVHRAIKKSSLIYSFSDNDKTLLEKHGAKKVNLMLDVGCEAPRTDNRQPTTDNLLHILWCGRLVSSKALDILLKALSSDPELMHRIKLTIVGDGPLRPKYEKLVKKILQPTSEPQPTTDNRQPITFTGWLPREEVFAHMRASDVLVHTSYREAASSVIPEALSCGLPVICHDISGMRIAVTDQCGIKVPLVSYKQSIIGFREALRVASCRLQVAGCKLRQSAPSPVSEASAGEGVGGEVDLRSGAFNRAKELSWDSMAERVANDYNLICSKE